MPLLSPVPLKILATRIIANAHPDFLAALEGSSGKKSKAAHKRYGALAMFTADCDDVGYIALDEATKQADVRVLYAGSFYAGAGNASMPWSGEFIGILAGAAPSDVEAGLAAAVHFYENGAAFHYADDNDAVIFLDHAIASSGSYLSAQAGVALGDPLAYLIAPPLEAGYALDAALKTADVRVAQYYRPPTPTNFSGALLSGPLPDCRAACAAFRQAVMEVAANPRGAL